MNVESGFIYLSTINLYDIIHNVDYESDNKIINKNNYDYIFSFNTEKYLIEIINSYSNSTNIQNQFKLDYDRHKIILNGYKYNHDKFKYYLKHYLSLYKFNQLHICTLPIELFIIMLCCQSSFAFPYQELVNLYSINENNNIVLCSSKKGTVIDININEKNINIELQTNLQIININNNDIIKHLRVYLIFLIDIEDIVNNTLIPSSILTWDDY